jgi:type IV pilus assembly protein PilC
MPTYSYEAIGLTGQRIGGNEVAVSERELAHVLKARGLVLVRSSAQTEKKQGSAFSHFFAGFFGVSLAEKLMFTRNLKVMVGAGIALPKALEILTLQAKQKQLKVALQDLREKVLQGHTLSQAMEMHPQVFSELFSNMVKVGEESGTLDNILSQLVLQLEKQYELKSRIQGALMYPAVILLAMIGIGVLMIVVVVPKLALTFRELNIPLPLTTRFVIGLGEFLTERWYIALALLAGGIVGFWRFFKTPKGKALKDSLLFHFPVVAGIVLKTNAATTVRTLSSLIGSGVPIVRSLEITSRVLGSSKFREALALSALEVGKGVKLSQALKAYTNLYPLLVVHMVEVGEETGKSAEVLSKLADFYEEEVGNATKNLAAVIEPLLMLFIGGVVGFFAVSMVQPMYSILQTLK